MVTIAMRRRRTKMCAAETQWRVGKTRFFGHCDRILGTTFPPALRPLRYGDPRSNTSEGQISPLNAQIKDKSR